MSTDQKIRYSKLLIWLGVLAWAPFILSRFMGLDLNGIPFLIAHLSGISGGLYLRRQAAKEMPAPSARIKKLKRFSTILLVIGVSVWPLYYLVRLLSQSPIELRGFLILHLAFVIVGGSMKMYIFSSSG